MGAAEGTTYLHANRNRRTHAIMAAASPSLYVFRQARRCEIAMCWKKKEGWSERESEVRVKKIYSSEDFRNLESKKKLWGHCTVNANHWHGEAWLRSCDSSAVCLAYFAAFAVFVPDSVSLSEE